MFSKTQKAIKKAKDKEIQAQQEKINLNKERILRRVKNEFYPFIKAHTKSIDDAILFMEVLGSTIQQKYMMGMKTTNVGELGLIDVISKDLLEEEANKWKGLLEMMKDESVFDMNDLLDNMTREIDDQLRRKISKEQTLDQLNVEIYEAEKLAD